MGFMVLAHFCLDDQDETSRDAKMMISFLSLYGLIFWVSAFGIVWYGIVIYFLMIIVIGYGMQAFTLFDPDASEEKLTFQIAGNILLCVLIGSYVVFGAFPHSWNNLVRAGYNEYKYFQLGQNESIFVYRNDYLTPIAALNLRDPQKAVQKAL